MSTTDAIALRLGAWRRDPVSFVREVLGVERIEQWQEQALRDLADPARSPHHSVRSGHGVGKAQRPESMVPTPEGFRAVGDVGPGDFLFGEDGAPVKVLAVRTYDECPFYRVTFSDGSSEEVSSGHMWKVRGRQGRRMGFGWSVLSTEDILRAGVKRPNGVALARQWELPKGLAVRYPDVDLPVDPYTYGVWLGDGDKRGARITNVDPEVWGNVAYPARTAGKTRTLLGLLADLKAAGLHGCTTYNATVDRRYMESAQRLAVLQGLLDTDGWAVHSGAVGFASASRQLTRDVIELARSLGLHARAEKFKPNDHAGSWSTHITWDGATKLFRIERKQAGLVRAEDRYQTKWIDAIEPAEPGPGVCFEVEGGLFRTVDFTVTHNSAFLSWCILWFLTTHFPAKAPCTAPTMHQIEDVLWGELALWRRKMRYGLADLFEVTRERIYLKAAPDECYGVARTARQENPDALQGFHSENILFLIDEASGVPDEIFQPLEGALSTPGAMSIMCGNPTKCRGYFYDSHHRNRAHFNTRKVSCHESSRVSPAYIEKMKAQYGEESNVYRVRVLGEFPLEDADVLIPLSIVLPARNREVSGTPCRPIWGLDVARYGECLNALAKRQGNLLLEPIKTWGNSSLMATVGRVVAEYEDTPPKERPHEIIVDVCGLGAGVVDRLLELDLPVRGLNAGESAPRRDAKRLSRMRDWLWWQGREWFQRMDCRIPGDEYLIGELADVHYTLNSSGKIQVESKRDLLDRGVPSPDRADAFLLTFAGSVLTSDEFEALNRGRRQRRKRSFMAS